MGEIHMWLDQKLKLINCILVMLCINKLNFCYIIIVATLALGSWLKQGLANVWAKSEAHESHFMLVKM
jgi:hypothetical protein